MYCEQCGALRQAGNAFCTSCGVSVAPEKTPQGGLQPVASYGVTGATLAQENSLGVRLATIACWLAFASAAFWLLGAGDRLVNRHGEEFVWYLKNMNWWYCIPLIVSAGMLLARRSHSVTGVALLIGTSVLLYATAFQLGIKFIDHGYSRYYSGPLSLNLLSTALAVGALGCVSTAVIQAKPKLSMPSTELTVVASLAGAFSALNTVLSPYGNHVWSFDLVFFVVGFPVWYQLLVVGFAVAIVASLMIGCLLGGRTAASVAIAGATYFGLLSIQTLFQDQADLASGFYFGVLACAAFIATAVIGLSKGKEETQAALLDPGSLAR